MYHIQVFGIGCVQCANLAQGAESVAQQLGVLYRWEEVNTLDRILEMG
jgi:hypothetical protein